LLFSCEPQMDPDWLDRLLASRTPQPSNPSLEKV
jgi:peptide/nickel transport system ATP-binding protein